MRQNLATQSALVRPVILSGGAGTRLWPLSRLCFPKQLLSLATSATMLQATVERVAGPEFSAPLIIADEDHRFVIKDQLEGRGLSAASILLEPEGRNTAAAIALAAHWSVQHSPDELLLVLPSDHVIRDVEGFRAAVHAAIPAARAGGLVTFGIRPDRPHTGYGYIEFGDCRSDDADVRQVARFVEKPSLELAQDYFDSGKFLWNSGMFLFQASAILKELERHEPAVTEAIARASANLQTDGPFVRPDSAAFCSTPNISIDLAVMEKTANSFVLPVDIGWSDVGSWESLWDISNKDEMDNVTRGPVLSLDSHDCLLRSEHGTLVVAIGLERIAVVVTRDAVLVTKLDRSEDVKAAVELLRKRGAEQAVGSSAQMDPAGSGSNDASIEG